MKKNKCIVICLGIFLLLCSCGKVSGNSATYTTNSEIGSEVILTPIEEVTSAPVLEDTNHAVDTGLIYTGDAYVVVNNNEPYFTDDEKKNTEAFEIYSSLDSLGRCGVAYANICQELMPTEKRESISSVKPSGWQSIKYDFVDGKYLYNRCHLIGFQLAGENANSFNLITGTRYLNIQGMLDFENLVADYVKETNNHVLYRVTPVYTGNNLVANGVYMEGWSVEDAGDGVCYNVYCFNVQPGVVIDYSDGTSKEGDPINTKFDATVEILGSNSQETHDKDADTELKEGQTYILNTNSKKFHREGCSEVKRIKSENKDIYIGNKESLISDNYTPCGKCNP